jgi:hypothetical protein
MSHSVSRYLRTEEQSFNNFAQRNQIVILETRMSPRVRRATKCSVFLGIDSMINQAEHRLPPLRKVLHCCSRRDLVSQRGSNQGLKGTSSSEPPKTSQKRPP